MPHIQLLGGLHLLYWQASVAGVNTPRLQSLLAYLVLHAGTPQLRQHVAFSLWPDSSETNARNSLRQLLHQLRQALPESGRFLAIDANTVCWQRGEAQTVDVWLFEGALAQAAEAERLGDRDGARRALEAAVLQYQGDLLPGCYDEWITPVRDDLRQRYQRAGARLVRHLEEERDYEAAISTAEAMVRCDPLEEEAYGRLMRLHARNADPAAVRRTFQAAVETLRRELGTEPDGGLRALCEQLSQTSPVAAGGRAGPAGREDGATLPLVGRRAEWGKLQAIWDRAASDKPHLVLIAGEAGIGKSRLAEELFTRARQQGFATAYTRSYGAEGHLSLGPITELLRSPALRAHWSGLDRVWLTEVARLVPELLAERQDLAAPQPITEAGGRQRFFEGLARG